MRAQLPCQILQGAKASIQFRSRQTSLAVETARKILGRAFALAEATFHAAGNEVAAGIAAEASAGHYVVEAVHVR